MLLVSHRPPVCLNGGPLHKGGSKHCWRQQPQPATLDVAYITVAAWRDGYNANGLDVRYDKARSGRPPIIDGVQRAKITALACSEAPDGHARWSLRLLAEKAVEAGVCDTIAYTSVRDILKKTS